MRYNLWLQRDFALAWMFGWLPPACLAYESVIDAMFVYYLCAVRVQGIGLVDSADEKEA